MTEKDCEIARELKDRLSEVVQVVDFRVFGSRARGVADEYSDKQTLFLYRLKQADFHTGKIEKHYSKILHKTFDAMQQGYYKELVDLQDENADEHVKLAKELLDGIKLFMEENFPDTEVKSE